MDNRTGGRAAGRAALALTGAAAGLALWAVERAAEQGGWSERAAFGGSTFVFVFFAVMLALVGPVTLRRAALGALGVAGAVAGLLVLAGLRFAHLLDLQGTVLPFLAAFVLGFVPLPFLIAAAGPGWQSYPALFSESWRLVVRATAAGLFAGLFWAVVWLSDSLLGLVGLGFVEALMGAGPLPAMLTGLAIGLGAATAGETGSDVGPELLIKLLRMLALPVLIVAVVFLVALPLQGMRPLAGGISAAGILLAMAGVMITLVSALVGREDAEASEGVFLAPVGLALAGLVGPPGLLALWALWLRVEQHGWTPGRLFAAMVGVLILGYALGYLWAVLRGGGWRGRVRRVNLGMAPVLALAAAVWLSPALNAEAISARGLVERFEAGEVAASELDLYALSRWGVAGEAARARLEALAREPGQEALAARLAGDALEMPMLPGEAEALIAELRDVMPLQPPTATATRDLLLAGIPAVELQLWLESCREPLPEGDRPGCVFVVADLWRDAPGEEAVVLLREMSGFIRYEGLGLRDGEVQRRSVVSMAGALPDLEAGAALIAALQEAPPPVEVAPLGALGAGGGILLLP